MKFKDVALQSQFTTDKHPELKFRKIKFQDATCCTEKANALYKKKDAKGIKRKFTIFFEDNEEVTLWENQ